MTSGRACRSGLRWLGLCALLFAAVPVVVPVAAQPIGMTETEVVVIDTDRLFNETEFGQTLRAIYEERREALIASNRELETQLEAEERELTAKRALMTPEAFRTVADAFDERVQKIRFENERVARDLEQYRENAQSLFVQQIRSVLLDLMTQSQAVVLLDARTVLLRLETVDITDHAVERINAIIGDGRDIAEKAYEGLLAAKD